MEIAQDTVVAFDYTLRNSAGEVVDSSDGQQPLSYLHGHGNIVPGLENALAGHGEGDEFDVTVGPEEGYGQYRDELIQTVPRESFPDVEQLEPGMRFHAQSDAGPMVVTVKDVTDDSVVVDGNHMLAGQELAFKVAVASVRAATAQELEHGHVHDDGHDHNHDEAG